DLYEEAVEFVATTKKASTSSLQRRFGIGYNRAARLIDTMEENGLIGTANGSKPREVYVKPKGSE
ncbi:MAG: DNA translocase FtsK, partial [Solobacterium sp.]|nr:DNA translocase FtsK [Solobacterium sp.]